ncbi:dihydroxyacetone kinase subunit DhaK [Actinomyces wuliandei]|uniref:dihydroxyacetone kinase subunit DhaK n=1 Tax=Actinomyces wuliandei TaxID=2057743 RepID=UPI000FDA2D8F|nr:dihydroxyacetone kinase subunit DhaK [Actinomyces wuliandei]
MKKLLNTADSFVRDTMEGIESAYGDRVGLLDGDYRVLVSRYPTRQDKVGVVTAGGSGHLPLFLGYVGQGLLDGCAVGEVFASPSAQKMADMIRACDRGRGVLCLYGNYNGDLFNFRMACDDVELDGIKTRQVLARDDVASAPPDSASRRRGVAGLVLAFKTAGAAAQEGMGLEEVAVVAQRTLDRTRTIGFALSPCVVPRVGEPTFSVGEDDIEVGMGIHGEAGIETRPMMSAHEVAQLAVETIEADMPLSEGEEVCVMVNGLGATPLEEQLIVYRSVHSFLSARGVRIVMPHVGEYATSMEMAGLSVTVLRLDEQLRSLLEAPAVSPFYAAASVGAR